MMLLPTKTMMTIMVICVMLMVGVMIQLAAQVIAPNRRPQGFGELSKDMGRLSVGPSSSVPSESSKPRVGGDHTYLNSKNGPPQVTPASVIDVDSLYTSQQSIIDSEDIATLTNSSTMDSEPEADNITGNDIVPETDAKQQAVTPETKNETETTVLPETGDEGPDTQAILLAVFIPLIFVSCLVSLLCTAWRKRENNGPRPNNQEMIAMRSGTGAW